MSSFGDILNESLADALKGAVESLKEELRQMIEKATEARQELNVYVQVAELAKLHSASKPTIERYLALASLDDSVRFYKAEPEDGKRGIVRYNAKDFEEFMLRYSKKNARREEEK